MGSCWRCGCNFGRLYIGNYCFGDVLWSRWKIVRNGDMVVDCFDDVNGMMSPRLCFMLFVTANTFSFVIEEENTCTCL